MTEELIAIEVAYALPEQQTIIALNLPKGVTVEQAISASKLLEFYPDINKAELKVGIFGSACKLEDLLKTGDRVEIYRPLHHDPKEARRQRALKR
jgi:putative ubiquitin-RnfH superfamily antitoxin RatB of RatAB toxin-antitoxin module